MRKRTYKIIGIFAILVIAGFFLYATSLDPSAPEGSVESKNAIRAFISDPNAVVVFKTSSKNVIGESYDIYQVNKDEFTVDPDTGSVVGADFLSVPRIKSKNLYIQQTENSAKDFASRHYNNFNFRNMQLTESKEWDYGSAGIEYSFTWSEQSMSINTSNTVRVSVNTDGRVIYYYARDKSPPTVKPVMVEKDRAVEIATTYVIDTTKISNISEKYISAQSIVMPDHRVVWNVDLQLLSMDRDNRVVDNRGGFVYIDAMTGNVVKYESCM
jgi:hypothetical protein